MTPTLRGKQCWDCTPVFGTDYFEFEWFVPKPGLLFEKGEYVIQWDTMLPEALRPDPFYFFTFRTSTRGKTENWPYPSLIMGKPGFLFAFIFSCLLFYSLHLGEASYID